MQSDSWQSEHIHYLNPIAFRKAKIVYNFGLSECNKVKVNGYNSIFFCCLGIEETAVFFPGMGLLVKEKKK